MLKTILCIVLLFSGKAFAVEYTGEGLTWKAVFMTGDNSIKAFDNARKTAVAMWRKAGIKPANIRQLSMREEFMNKRVKQASEENLEKAFQQLAPGNGDACLLWMTSHGNKDGLFMVNQPPLAPTKVDEILNKYCGKNPTVLVVSACHSGIFLDLANDNRVILTAAHEDRKSFGCGIKNKYTFYDQCLIKYYKYSKTFEGLNYRAKICIDNREGEEEVIPSMPQAKFGKNVKYLLVPRPQAKKRKK